MTIKKYRVNTRNLRKDCKASIFQFGSTAEVEPLKGIFGQDRATRSLLFALDIENEGYNAFIIGTYGTEKTTLTRELLTKKAVEEPVPNDWCYVYNFQRTDRPKALELPPGRGKAFKNDVVGHMDKIIKQIIKAFESEDFDYKKNEIVGSFIEKANALYIRLEEEARPLGFTISRSQSGINSIPIKNGEPLSQEDYMAMSEEEKIEMMKRSGLVQEKINSTLRQYRDLEKYIKKAIKDLEQETARTVTVPFFTDLFMKYRDLGDVVEYLENIQRDSLDNVDMFVKHDDNVPVFLRHIDRRAALRRYQINLLVDNSELKHAPVIFENNPTFANLFGQIEYEGEFGILTTDFSKIKSGSIHRANGGYLVLNAYDMLKNPYVWDTLKRVLKDQEISVESITRMIGISNTETLEPEPIPIKVKVLLIGEALYYHLLYQYDQDFRSLFRIRADFDVEMERNKRTIYQYAQYISGLCREKNLLPFAPSGVARVVDYGTRLAGDQRKLSTLFDRIGEIVLEANQWASCKGAKLVEARHVDRAISEKKYRSSSVEEKIQDLIENRTIIINTSGFKVGELNGLAVHEMGDYSFGRPVRITAKTFMGEKGLVNIEREIRMSGSIHSKGVLILSGFMGAYYAQDYPLSLSASLTFEQSYQGIEGDSASSAELYALLSSLAEVKINQGIAVTGSVNQNGEVQPVGGVNEKIEGFFRVCCNHGLTGQQGVLIPKQNICNLMLDDEVIDAVKNRKFNIWAISHIDEGIEILTGMPAGERDETGRFPPHSFHYLVDNKLREWSAKSRWWAGSNDKTKQMRRRRV
ncbi:MAG: Lon protease family protein [Syntrophomonadaceae bacterium]